MAWNQPGKNQNTPDSGDSNNQKDSNTSEINKKTNNQSPPDLEDLFHKLRKKIINLGNRKNNSNNNVNIPSNNENKLMVIIISAALSVWIFNGFYTINETEQGVITSLGKFTKLVSPGVHWKPKNIETVHKVDVGAIRELSTVNSLLTADENLIYVKMNVQYRVNNPVHYLYSIDNPDDTLQEVTDSAVRIVIGKNNINDILKKGELLIRNEVEYEINKIISKYKMGIMLVDIHFDTLGLPAPLKDVFYDVILSRQNRKDYVKAAKTYAHEVKLHAKSQAQRMIEKAFMDKEDAILRAKSELVRLMHLLRQYKAAPKITKEYLYFKTIERMLHHAHKALLNKSNNIFLLPPLNALNDINNQEYKKKLITNKKINLRHFKALPLLNKKTLYDHSDIMEQRRIHAMRDDIYHLLNNQE